MHQSLIFGQDVAKSKDARRLGGVYMRKLAPARVSYRDDFLISDRVYMSYLVIWRYTSCWQNKGVIQNRKYYARATRSSLPADWFHTETCGRLAFTWYRCEISYRSEILAPVQQPRWTQTVVTRAGMTFCGGTLWKQTVEPWEGTGVHSLRRESRPGVM